MASNEGEYSYGALEGLFAGRFMRGLVDSGWSWDEAFQRVAGDPGVTAWESPQWWSKSGPCEGIDIWLEDGTVRPGENVLVPVYIQDVTGWGAVGFETQICWCDTPAGLLQYEYCVPGDVMTGSGWGDPVCNPCDPNCVNIAAAGAAPLTGGGVLFYLKFHVSINAKPCMCCDLRFEYLNLYDPEETLEVCLTDGSVCVEHCYVEGWVKYWKCCQDECDGSYLARPLDHAYVHLFDCGGAVASQYTDEQGHYLFECLNPMLEGCPYCIYVDHWESMDGCITAYDASLILQYLVCLDDLDDCVFTTAGGAIYPQMVAADANCSGHTTAYDASLILQYVVGLIDIFPCPDPWQFFPIAGVCPFECPGDVNWIGVHVADVSGCPECPPGPGPLVASGGPTRIKLGKASHSGDMVEIPVIVKGAEDIKSVELDVAYNTADFSVETVVADGLAGSFLTFWHAEGGHIRVAMAGMHGMNGRGRIATIRLAKTHAVPSVSGRIWLSGVLFNEGVPQALIDTGSGPVEIRRFALGPVSPNPFVGGTTVNYSVPASADVTLRIYNVSGQLVTTLVDRDVAAGRQSVWWDGKDSSGRRVSRGVYFCRMKAGSFSETQKVVLLQ
jgi:hypothetical protein